ncbi:MAG: hypothetical protein VX836_03235 [Pseudomonadota bacterium]|jgi:hypothetical protein|nr:hypothetical protein [Pseudomonadota bacterium]
MSLLAPAPQSIGQVLDRGFRLFRNTLVRMLPLTSLYALFGTLPALFDLVRIRMSDQTSLVVLSVVGSVACTLISFVLMIAVIRYLDDLAEERHQMTRWQAFWGAWRHVLPLIFITLVMGLLIMVGFVLLIVPGVWAMVGFSLCWYLRILDREGVFECLAKSWNLVRGHWWRSATVLGTATLIYLAVYVACIAVLALLLPFGQIGDILTQSESVGTWALLAYLVGNAVLSAVLYPLIYAIPLVLLRDLQVRKGGDDLAARIDQSVT